ncbi:MAG: TRAP transporter fused permease subunit [Rhodospirillales bacterium]|nr:TRAP transporter fused permease subunit [Rhodospirillales bacterium]MBO6786332.1 TRAP transporter fused permease subunit [Rhodospirillales bacterium]
MVLGLAAVSVAFHLYLIFSGLIPNLISRPIHMALALPWVFVFVRAENVIERVAGWILAALGIGICGYIALYENALGEQYGYLSGSAQMAMAAVLIAIVLEMARRAINWPLPLVALIVLAYGMFGEYVPGEFGHPGLPLASLLGNLTIAEAGFWGPLTGVSVNVVAVFVILGAVLNAGEAGQGFMNLAIAVAGRLRAGAAKVSVLASALFGSLSGSASANVASTGAVTLPAMKRLGYPPSLAAAVEAVASSGGQIMPPLMGAGAFVMVELLGVPYTDIMAAALLPALLFFLAVWVGVDGFAKKTDLRAMDTSEQPDRKTLLITGLFFAVPFAVLLERLFIGGYTPQYASAVAILVSTLLLVFNAEGKFSVPMWAARFADALVNAASQIATVASIILCAGIVIGVLQMTGLGVKVTSTIIALSGGELWAALLLTALACLILGMEVPTTAAYVICVSVTGPALEQLGLPLLHAHLFVFWFALLSTITPPVCGTVFIAAGMADAPWLRVAGVAMRLGLGLYLIPLAFVANPALIALKTDPFMAVVAMIKIGAALWLISHALIADRPVWQRLGAGVAGAALIFLMPVGAA